MSTLTVITFDDEKQAGRVRNTLRKLEDQGNISLADSAVVVKDKSGKVQVKNEMDHGVKVGAMSGSMIGLLISSIFFPVGGLLVGAIGGGILGKAMGDHVDGKFVREVTDSLHPGSSAIFFVVRSSEPAAVQAALKPYHGKVYHTSLSAGAEESLRQSLKK